MFNFFPQGVGEQVQRGAQAVTGALGSIASRFTNPIQAVASDFGAIRGAVAGMPLIGGRRTAEPVAANIPQLPSGTMATGADIYPTAPQMAQSRTATMPASTATANPIQIQGNPFSAYQAFQPTSLKSPQDIAFPTAQNAQPQDYISGGAVTTGRVAVQTPYGAIQATPQQAQAFAARPTAYEGRTPAQQQALLAQVRERGRSMLGAQEQFFAQKRAEQKGLSIAAEEARIGGIGEFDIMKARGTTQPASNLAAIRQQAYQYSQRLPMEGVASRASSLFARNLPTASKPSFPSSGLGLSGYDLYNYQLAQKRAMGQTGPFSNSRAVARRAAAQAPQPQAAQLQVPQTRLGQPQTMAFNQQQNPYAGV